MYSLLSVIHPFLFSTPWCLHVLPCFHLPLTLLLSHHLSYISLQSLDEDCTLEEEDEGLIEEEDDIDQFNDDTFGAGAIGESCLKYDSSVFINY